MSDKSIYLVNPAADYPTYFSLESSTHHGLRPAVVTTDLALPTVAAMAPDGFEVSICEEAVSPVDFDTSAAYVGITGKFSQWRRMKALAAEFRRRGKTVIIGGPQASLMPQAFRDDCDILVHGEMENIAAELFADLAAGTWRDEYFGDHADLSRSPAPRWDLYPHDRALAGSVQTSRGCPFSCEFCDASRYVGRHQRHKPTAQVIVELDALYRLGLRRFFFADDNFTGNRPKVKELLETLIDWNGRREDGRVCFDTELSVDAPKDDSLLQMLSDAGFNFAFLGLETPNAASLREVKKHHNLDTDMAEQVRRLVRRGIAVRAGLMVGFDEDGLDIFERQYEFVMSNAVPIVLLNVLCACPGTPVYERLQRENRLVRNGEACCELPPYADTTRYTNIVPRQMTREQLLDGAAALVRKLYHPIAFGERLAKVVEQFALEKDQPANGGTTRRPATLRKVDSDIFMLPSRLRSLGPLEEQLFDRTLAAIAKKPAAREIAIWMLGEYLQIRMIIEQSIPQSDARKKNDAKDNGAKNLCC